MAKLVVKFGLFCNISTVDAELGLPHQYISIAEVDQKIPVTSFESVFNSYHFKFFAIFGHGRWLHLFEQVYDFCGRFSFDFAAKQVIDVENKLVSLLFVS